MFSLEKNHQSARLGCLLAVVALTVSTALSADKSNEAPVVQNVTGSSALFWSDPGDIATRDLFYGQGGKAREPHGPFQFEKEDLNGSNPKFVVHDRDGVEWKVKLGLEARPETAATRLVWAAGYYVSEDYFMHEIKIDGMPARLHRGQRLLGPGGTAHNVRLKREDEKKIGTWQWDTVGFAGSREWNGLRVLMAVIGDWDLKDANNSVYRTAAQSVYMVSDLGATFGTAGVSWPISRAKGNLTSYSHSKFIRHIGPDTVDFQAPARPSFVRIVNPKAYLARVHLEHLGRNVPRADARWLGQLLSRLAPAQIQDAFRAAGYSPQEAEAFVRLLEDRIAALVGL